MKRYSQLNTTTYRRPAEAGHRAPWQTSCWQMKKMEPQSTRNTQIGACQDKLDALSKWIIGCALTVMRASGT
jgi:hypothetical protein